MSVMHYRHTMSSDEAIEHVAAELYSMNMHLSNLYNVVAIHAIAIILTWITVIVLRFV